MKKIKLETCFFSILWKKWAIIKEMVITIKKNHNYVTDNTDITYVISKMQFDVFFQIDNQHMLTNTG